MDRHGVGRFLAWIGILLLTLWLIFVGGGWQGIYTSGLRLASDLLAAATLAVWLLVAWKRPAWRPTSRLMPAILAVLGSLAISTLLSRYPRISLEYLGYAIVLTALYLMLVRLLAMPFFRARITSLAGLLGVALSVAFVGLVAAHWIDYWNAVGRIATPPLRPMFESLTYGNPSAVMTICLLLGTTAVARIGPGSRRQAVLVAAVGVLVAATTLLSGSRSGWLAVGVAALATGLLWLVRAGGHRRVARVVRAAAASPRVRLGGMAVVLVAGIAAIALGPAILLRATAYGGDLRLSFVAVAMRMFAESPLVGTGPGTWVVQRVRYTVAPETDYYIPHAHDIYAQTLAELGLVGILAGLVLAVCLWRLLDGAVRDQDPIRRRWGLAAAFAIVYFAVHQVLDLYVNMPAIMAAAVVPVAWLDATSTGTQREAVGARAQRARANLVHVGAVLVLAVALAGVTWAEGPAGTAETATNLANAGDWTAADAQARAAVRADPGIPAYWMTMGLTAAHVGDDVTSADALARVAAADDLPEAWLDLAAEQAILGRTDEARASLANALRLGSQRTAINVASADLALRLGDPATAVAALDRSLAAVPSLAADPWWRTTSDRAALMERAVSDASGSWPILLFASGPVAARAATAGLLGDEADLADRVLTAWDGDAAARQALYDRCLARPLDTAWGVWCGRVAVHAGERSLANRFQQIRFEAADATPEDILPLGVADPPPTGRGVEAGLAVLYGHYTYRRPTPWDLLVPSLPHLSFR